MDLTTEFDYKDLITWQSLDKLAENDNYILNGATAFTGIKSFAAAVNITAAGSAAVPALSIGSSGNTGFRATGTTAALIANGVDNLIWDNSNLTAKIVVSLIAGSVSAPSLNFSDVGTGFYRKAQDQIGFASAGVLSLAFSTTGIADDTVYAPFEIHAGSGGNSAAFSRYTTSGVTTAKQIGRVNNDFGILLVVGQDGGGNEFIDLIISADLTVTAPTVISSFTVGTPAARTYSSVNGQVKVAMASGTYSISSLTIGLNKR